MDLDRDLLLRSFFAESEENIASMERAVLALEKGDQDGGLLQGLFRDAHTLKGNALSLGFPALAAFAHKLEDRLETLREGKSPVSPSLVTVLLGAVDALRDLLGDASSGKYKERGHHKTLLEQLEDEHDGKASPKSAVPARAAPQPSAPPAAAQSGGPELATSAEPYTEAVHSLRVGVDKLDRMLALSGEIAIARGRVRKQLSSQGDHDISAELDRLSRDLQEQILAVRAVPLGPTFSQHARTVRDAAQSGGKEVRLEIEGEDVELDTAVVELLRDPLTHLVRNAVAHGIEKPAQRIAAGKPSWGTVRLSAHHEGAGVTVQVSDDGQGFDRARIIASARARGFAVNENAPDDELFKVVFEPGFTTAEEVTDLSGRGVGLDVVRHNLDKVRGAISIDNEPGKGCTFTLRLPLTMAIIDAFFVGAGGETYAIPLESMIECIDLPGDEGEAGGVLSFRGEALPWLSLSQHFGGSASAGKRRSLVVVQHGRGRAGIAVERLDGEDQTVLKPLSGLIRDAPGVAGSALLADGRVALILDVPSLLSSAAEAARASASSSGRVS